MGGRIIAAAVFVVVILIAMAGVIANFYTDLLWFKDLGQESVFWTRIWSEVAIGLVFGVISLLDHRVQHHHRAAHAAADHDRGVAPRASR